ncbi:hypothetical protein CMUST_10260 [Corynebacterium mustelae]|uniref:Uncharacterized protein n=1 Tax=Corynebacterium mustelae TaxID=571915 RepID=A0A0G3H3G2_9CORY|nr:hypothetical protein [Corynebacterium mustelae]AKK06368.1 hypothetical protein CMUST_10260 [Corynebacterium mustelae]
MPNICFDCLVPDVEIDQLAGRFRTLSDILTRDGRVAGADISVSDNPQVAPDISKQLRQTYRDEHHELFESIEQAPRDVAQQRMTEHGLFDPDAAQIHRIMITLDSVSGSVNQIAMLYSRLLTPPAPTSDPATMLFDEQSLEIPARYPWTVIVTR